MKKVVRLTESDLNRIVKRVIEEENMNICEKAMDRMRKYASFGDFNVFESHGHGGVAFEGGKKGTVDFWFDVDVDPTIIVSIDNNRNDPFINKVIKNYFIPTFQNSGKKFTDQYGVKFEYQCAEVERFMAAFVAFEKVMKSTFGMSFNHSS